MHQTAQWLPGFASSLQPNSGRQSSVVTDVDIHPLIRPVTSTEFSVINVDKCPAICPVVALEHLSCGPAEELLPALHYIQQEPAWRSIMAGHRPQDWPDNAPPAASQFHQAITYLSSERVLNDEAAQAIHSFYTFMLVSLIWQHACGSPAVLELARA